jgi:hypothetical protein
VLVHSDPPQTVTMTGLAEIDVDEGTPVLDEAGDLIGLCTNERQGVALRTVGTMPDDPTTTVAPTEPTTPPSTAPTTVATSPPTTSPATAPPTTTTVPSTSAAPVTVMTEPTSEPTD